MPRIPAQSLELARRSGERGDLVVALNTTGVLERQRDRYAAKLCGARDALRAKLGSGVPPAYVAGYARTVQAVRSTLDADAFAQAYEWGGQLPLEETIAAALRAVDGSSPESDVTIRSSRMPRL